MLFPLFRTLRTCEGIIIFLNTGVAGERVVSYVKRVFGWRGVRLGYV